MQNEFDQIANDAKAISETSEPINHDVTSCIVLIERLARELANREATLVPVDPSPAAKELEFVMQRGRAWPNLAAAAKTVRNFARNKTAYSNRDYVSAIGLLTAALAEGESNG